MFYTLHDIKDFGSSYRECSDPATVRVELFLAFFKVSLLLEDGAGGIGVGMEGADGDTRNYRIARALHL